MAAWLAEVENLIEAEQRLAEQRIEADRLRMRIEAARAPLADLARTLRARRGAGSGDRRRPGRPRGAGRHPGEPLGGQSSDRRLAARCRGRRRAAGGRARRGRDPPRRVADRMGGRDCCPSDWTARRDPRRPKVPWKHGAPCRTAWRSAPRCCAGRPGSAGTWRGSGRPLPPSSEAWRPTSRTRRPPGRSAPSTAGSSPHRPARPGGPSWIAAATRPRRPMAVPPTCVTRPGRRSDGWSRKRCRTSPRPQ